jgi:hypothetical protein
LLPNPNVLIEYGWALEEPGDTRIIVMNKAFGEPSEKNLPFDMRHRRWPITYDLVEGASTEDRSKVKKQLIADLAEAIEAIVRSGDLQEEDRSIQPTSNPSTFLRSGEHFHRPILTLKKFNLHLLYIYLKLKDSYPCG